MDIKDKIKLIKKLRTPNDLRIISKILYGATKYTFNDTNDIFYIKDNIVLCLYEVSTKRVLVDRKIIWNEFFVYPYPDGIHKRLAPIFSLYLDKPVNDVFPDYPNRLKRIKRETKKDRKRIENEENENNKTKKKFKINCDFIKLLYSKFIK